MDSTKKPLKVEETIESKLKVNTHGISKTGKKGKPESFNSNVLKKKEWKNDNGLSHICSEGS